MHNLGLIGSYVLVPEFSLESSHLQGLLFGLLSVVCYAIRILLLKAEVTKYHGTMLMFYQMLIIFILLLPVAFIMDTSNITTQYPYIIILALVTSAIGHTLFVTSVKKHLK